MLDGACDQRVDFGAARDVAGDDERLAALLADAVGDLFAGIKLAAGDHDFRAKPRQQFSRRAADAAARAGDDRDLAAEIERGVFHYFCLPDFLAVIARSASDETIHTCFAAPWIGLLRFARNEETLHSG